MKRKTLYEKYLGNLPMPDFKHPPFEVMPQSLYDKKMAKVMQKFMDYQWQMAMDSKMITTPWGTLIWTPKRKSEKS